VQIGMITLTFQVAGALFQPAIGLYTDRHPLPYSTVVGMVFTLLGIVSLAYASSYVLILVSVTLVGIGSSIFHPDATRSARDASGGRHGLAQVIFQVGGQIGGALGPLLAAFIIVSHGQTSLSWFAPMPILAMALLVWTAGQQALIRRTFLAATHGAAHLSKHDHSRGVVVFSLVILTLLIFSKLSYIESFRSFYTFYLIDRFGVSIATSQMMLFVVFLSSAAGVLLGGIVGDRIGRYRVIWISVLGPLPFTLILPYADLFWTGVLTVIINLIMAQRFCVHHDLRHGPCPETYRPDRRRLLRTQYRLGRDRCRLSRGIDGHYRNRGGQSDLLVPAGGRAAYMVFAEAEDYSRRPLRAGRCLSDRLAEDRARMLIATI
jgi:MFS transporter, FSR family, fosmidomycin resistance protein